MSFVDELRTRVARDWPAIVKARTRSREIKDELSALLTENGFGFDDQPAEVTSDAGIVIFGSLAREEWTSGSDLDWTLLVDGQADYQHAQMVRSIARVFREAKFKVPGPSDLFGRATFSHGLVHQIGGLEDSNPNTTRRLLLLLESSPLANSAIHDRVVTGVLSRYLANDTGFSTQPERFRAKVPRFLYNDIDRFWRTLTVDYASKYWDRGAAGWALRHTKLRMSRKLTFLAGAISCFSCEPTLDGAIGQTPPRSINSLPKLVTHLKEIFARPPLEIVAEVLLRYEKDSTATILFDAYDRYLDLLDDAERREHLEQLDPDVAEEDGLFSGEVTEITRAFQESLEFLLFRDDNPLVELIRKYGVF